MLTRLHQIAAILDRSFPQDRTYLFWNVVITYMLSVRTTPILSGVHANRSKTSDQCPADKKALYGMLSLKQMQRAAQTVPVSAEGDSDRAVRGEEEVLLYYRILETHGSKEDWQTALDDPRLGPVKQFRLGRKDLFLRALEVCTQREEWQSVYKLCKECLVGTDETRQINLLACDWGVWEHFLEAAGHLRATQSE